MKVKRKRNDGIYGIGTTKSKKMLPGVDGTLAVKHSEMEWTIDF